MGDAERIARAQRLASHQKAKVNEFLHPPKVETKPPRPEPQVPDVVDCVRETHRHFSNAPLGPAKIWFHVCCWAAVYAWFKMLTANPIGTIILTPLVMTILWVSVNLPSWLSEGFSSGTRNSGGKYV